MEQKAEDGNVSITAAALNGAKQGQAFAAIQPPRSQAFPGDRPGDARRPPVTEQASAVSPLEEGPEACELPVNRRRL